MTKYEVPMPDTYHMRRTDKVLDDHDALFGVLSRQKAMTLALCHNGEPYLVTVNYGFDAHSHSFYFHCAPAGKKIDFLRANPVVWGQVVEDLGYMDGQCDHAYRSVQFRGRAHFVEEFDQKRRALELMIDQLESEPEPVKTRTLTEPVIRGVCIIKISADFFTGKEGPAPAKKNSE
jgi:nitroimidazol reductase NimA-like FMN-containing flavoprotein (pyridoxamine 5'-phosphate oxidase superfamily)